MKELTVVEGKAALDTMVRCGFHPLNVPTPDPKVTVPLWAVLERVFNSKVCISVITAHKLASITIYTADVIYQALNSDV